MSQVIPISFTALADFMTASAVTQRKTLLDYKYPDEDEPRAKRLYYREAREAIQAYHSGAKEAEWLQTQADRLAQMADLSPNPRTKTRLANNARVLVAYAKHYDGKSLLLRPPFHGELRYGNILVRVNPDLHGTEHGRVRVIRLDFSKRTPDRKYSTIVVQLMYEAAAARGLALPTSAFIVRHIESRTNFSGARKGAKLMRDITATCENIEGIWNTL